MTASETGLARFDNFDNRERLHWKNGSFKKKRAVEDEKKEWHSVCCEMNM